MAPNPLVDAEIAAGRTLVKELDSAGFRPSVAVWIWDDERGEYRLLLSVPALGRHGSRSAYSRIRETLEQAGLLDTLPLHHIQVVAQDHELVRALRALVKTAPDALASIRLRDNAVNNMVISDAYIYRAA